MDDVVNTALHKILQDYLAASTLVSGQGDRADAAVYKIRQLFEHRPRVEDKQPRRWKAQ